MVDIVPNIVFKTRVKDNDCTDCPNPYKWEDKSTDDYFSGKKVVLFSLPGAFTPTCSTYQLPDFEGMYSQFKEEGIDDIYCMSCNDAFVMNKWAEQHSLENVKVIPDGNGDFTSGMGMLVKKENLGFGDRSWRYAAIINDKNIEHLFVEPNKKDNADDDPYGETSPQNILQYIKSNKGK